VHKLIICILIEVQPGLWNALVLPSVLQSLVHLLFLICTLNCRNKGCVCLSINRCLLFYSLSFMLGHSCPFRSYHQGTLCLSNTPTTPSLLRVCSKRVHLRSKCLDLDYGVALQRCILCLVCWTYLLGLRVLVAELYPHLPWSYGHPGILENLVALVGTRVHKCLSREPVVTSNLLGMKDL